MYAAASVSHSIFLDSSGAAFTCGKGRGLLGHGDAKIKTVPTRVQSLEVIIITKLTLTLHVSSQATFFFYLTGPQDSECSSWRV